MHFISLGRTMQSKFRQFTLLCFEQILSSHDFMPLNLRKFFLLTQISKIWLPCPEHSQIQDIFSIQDPMPSLFRYTLMLRIQTLALRSFIKPHKQERKNVHNSIIFGAKIKVRSNFILEKLMKFLLFNEVLKNLIFFQLPIKKVGFITQFLTANLWLLYYKIF